MKTSRMFAAVVALLVLALSLFSSPVTPAEHPWDSDGGSGQTGTAPGDTGKIVSPGGLRPLYSVITGNGWFTNLASSISTQLTNSFKSVQSSLTKSGKSTSSSRNQSSRMSGRTNSPSE